MINATAFEDAERGRVPEGDELVVDLDGYEGPLDVLLTLAREQKVDLTKISILALADQYLVFIATARRLKLEVAADYLVMAAWLAYLKSRLLLPEPPGPEEPTGDELAAMLTHQLRRLEAMRGVAARLMALPRLDRDVFGRGSPEGLPRRLVPRYEATLLEMLRAYGELRQRKENAVLRIVPPELYSMDDALERLKRMVGRVPEWRSLISFLPAGLGHGLIERSAIAATFAASLELVRAGKLELRQDRSFGPVFVRSKPGVI
jgi:segregation and condensation protein A